MKRHINKIPWLIALLGWVLYVLDDTISKVVFDVAKEGITVERILQLITLSAVAFLGVRVERITQLFRIFKTNIKVETGETIGNLTAKLGSQAKELRKMSDDVESIKLRQEATSSKLESVWIIILALIFIIANSSAFTQEE